MVSGSLSVAPPPPVHLGYSRPITWLLPTLIPNVYACNTCNYTTQWGSRGSGNGQFDSPQGVAVDSPGNVYVADSSGSISAPYGNNRVEKFTSTGTYVTQFGCATGVCSVGSAPGQFFEPYGVAVDSSGNLYVADFGNSRVEKFTSTGTYVTQWGSYGFGPGQFDTPRGVAVDSSGNVYVTDYGGRGVEKFTSTGTYITQWGSYGSSNGQFKGPSDVAVDSDGNVYVVDSGNVRVEKFTSTGTYVTQWGSYGSGPGQFFGAEGIAVDSSGNVYVADERNNRVEKFTNTGTYVSQLGCATGACTAGSAPGQFNGPTGVAVDSSGNVYVADRNNNRVEIFGDTTTTTTATSGIPGFPVESILAVVILAFVAIVALAVLRRRNRYR